MYKRNKRLEAKDVLPNINRTQAAERAEKCRFLSLVTLTFDLNLQTRPREGPNTSSVLIWCKSFQRFPRYFIHKQKTQTDGVKNRTFRSSLRAVKTKNVIRIPQTVFEYVLNIRIFGYGPTVASVERCNRVCRCSCSKARSTTATVRTWRQFATSPTV